MSTLTTVAPRTARRTARRRAARPAGHDVHGFDPEAIRAPDLEIAHADVLDGMPLRDGDLVVPTEPDYARRTAVLVLADLAALAVAAGAALLALELVGLQLELVGRGLALAGVEREVHGLDLTGLLVRWGGGAALLAVGPVALALYAAAGLYGAFPLAPVQEVRTQAHATAAAFALVVALAVALGHGSPSLFLALMAVMAVALGLGPAFRLGARAAFARRPWWGCPVVVLGAGETGRQVVRALQEQPELGLRPVAALDDDLTKRGVLSGVPVPGGVALAPRYAAAGVRYAVVAMPGVERKRLVDIVERYATAFDRTLVIPDLFGLGSLWVSARDLDGVLGFELRHRLLAPWRQALKRALDLAVAVVAAALFALPALALVALIRLDSPGPALYRQLRLGRDGRCFSCYKFRSMHVGAERRLEEVLAADPQARAEYARYAKLRRDPRVTRVGRWLRRLSLDELPQLLNVLRGEMSVVGPRAYLPAELEGMGPRHRTILRVRPGVTGLWQVMGRSRIPFEGRLDLDVHYIRNWSVSLDLYLLARTVPAVVAGRGAA